MTSGAGVFVAGGTGALGVEVVRALVEAGWPVTATWIAPDRPERVAPDLEGARGVTFVEADLTDPAAAERAVAAAGDLAAVITTVGGYAGGRRVHEDGPATLERMLRLNLVTAFNVARAGLPPLLERGGGAFVAVAARAALRPGAGAAAYAASKAGVVALVQALDAEYRRDGVRANAIVPSVIDTPANRAAMPSSDRAGWTPPERIARVVRFLVSDESAATSGAAIPV